ncbi:MAG: accessory Sec system translocase SecA2 [Acidobacteria bacterium]|nr:accessory Sec system translocase SecA2 [Acidobacteriota bacterium]
MFHLRSLFSRKSDSAGEIEAIHRHRESLAGADPAALRDTFRATADLLEATAIVALTASRLLALDMFDVQLRGALALARGRIAEMQTGEGKTLACTPAVAWMSRGGRGVHVMTVNDYLARRDARWMGPMYEALGLSVGCIQQTMDAAARRRAYACDITYATANEIGFDFLRDRIALAPEEQVHRAFQAALIDEADSILIDEARIPLVLAGGASEEVSLARQVDPIVRRFQPGLHFTLDEYGRNIAITDSGAEAIEGATGVANLYAEACLPLYTAVHNAVHAHFLLRRDVDYIIKDGAVESVDEFKGRIAPDRRWPAGLHTAIEEKEQVASRRQGRVLASITLQNLIALYPTVSGMTGTAATQAEEFRSFYNLAVEVIPTNRPVIRADEPDRVFPTKAAKEQALVEEIRAVHSTGQPVLVGTASVEESERLSRALAAIPHSVLNARNEEEEAGIVARAGRRGAVTISTNMAGRGVDIQLGEGVAELGGLYVIGANRHEARRIDHQLRGRAGRQGDPGRSRFFISLEDDLLVKYGIGDERLHHDAESIQRVMEGQNLEIRRFLQKYESVVEGQRRDLSQRREAILHETALPAAERAAALTAIDDLWSDHLAATAELRTGVQWYAWGGRDPLHEYLTRVDQLYLDLEARLEDEIAARMEAAREGTPPPVERGATWTYLTTDNPFGSLTERVVRHFVEKFRR